MACGKKREIKRGGGEEKKKRQSWHPTSDLEHGVSPASLVNLGPRPLRGPKTSVVRSAGLRRDTVLSLVRFDEGARKLRARRYAH